MGKIFLKPPKTLYRREVEDEAEDVAAPHRGAKLRVNRDLVSLDLNNGVRRCFKGSGSRVKEAGGDDTDWSDQWRRRRGEGVS